MRGARRLHMDERVSVGIIPADAGSTRGRGRSLKRSEDHPRGCGEHCPDDTVPLHWGRSSPRMRGALAELRGLGGLQGSSPRMRGALSGAITYATLGRIIPADAGSTGSPSHRTGRAWDHPRGCGEHGCVPEPIRQPSGSSPRMRGARVFRRRDIGGVGIIPADAGSTAQVGRSFQRYGDHPRGCGEHTGMLLVRCGLRGSSPRMRGAQDLMLMPDGSAGIIPADAGNTLTASEYIDPPQGSSPRMRGTRCCAISQRVDSGIIPADAGNTVHAHRRHMRTVDHPRGCGEHLSRSVKTIANEGSSPRMRGTHGLVLAQVVQGGIIPADAGNTSCAHQ